MFQESEGKDNFISLTADIVSAHVSNNVVAVSDVPRLVEAVFSALKGLNASKDEAPKQQPAVPIRGSVKQDYIVCLEDGKKVKMLKPHLAKRYQLTPDQYRRKWNLPDDYPMVAPGYTEHRRYLAKKIGLGHKAFTPAVRKQA
jgi:predicted transcriptional regulator